MPAEVDTGNVQDRVARVNDEIAVGSDMEFQRRWWRFERILWIVLTMVVILDALGFFGRGWFAKAHARTADGSMNVDYERIERFGSPSKLIVHFESSAVRDGKIQLWASNSLLHELGNQSVSPRPDESALVWPGILYTYTSSADPNSVQFSLEPAKFGVAWLTLRVPGHDELRLPIIIFPWRLR